MESRPVKTATSRNGGAPPIERADALAAMLQIEGSMIEATRQMIELNQRLPTLNARARLDIRNQLTELSAIIATYAEQIDYLRKRYEAGE
jgi:hypothetical protein